MDKDTLKLKIREKAQRVADSKIDELVKYLDKNFNHNAKEMILSSSLWASQDISKTFRSMILEDEIESAERDFYLKIESLFYHLSN